MEDRILQFRVGLVVVAAAIVASILVVLFGAGPNLLGEEYRIYVRFPEAPGVAIDTPVRKNGVLIGRVAHVELLEEGGVLLTLRIEEQYKLRHNELARISTASLLGDAVIEFVLSGEPSDSADPIQPGDFLANGSVAVNPLRMLVDLEDDIEKAIGAIQGAGNTIESAGQEVQSLAHSMNGVIGDNEGQMQRLMEKTETALDGFQKTMVTIDKVVGDPEMQANLRQAIGQLPEVMNQTHGTLADARVAMANFRKVSDRANVNLANLEKVTQPLGDRSGELMERIDRSLTSVDELLAQLILFSESLNNPEGSLGRLINDPEIYEELARAADNLEDASQELRPVMDDVRIFTDKIAADPRLLGVAGALDRRPLGVGLKMKRFEALAKPDRPRPKTTAEPTPARRNSRPLIDRFLSPRSARVQQAVYQEPAEPEHPKPKVYYPAKGG